jgi:hypothetical protein
VDCDGMVIGVDTGFHCSPIYRGRSAREPEQLRVTAASLGHETICNYKGNRKERKIWGNTQGFGMRAVATLEAALSSPEASNAVT